MTPTDELQTLLETGGVEGAVRERVARYGALLLEANQRFNLTGAKSAAELAPHLLDSLTIAPYVSDSLVDIGSGGGLPAIPLALATGVPVTMVETTVKKARFLGEMLAAFDLRGEVVAERAEVAAHEARLRGAFTTGTARAVSSAPTVAELLLPFLAIGGVAVMQRGTMDDRERNALADAALMLGAEVEREEPLDGERRVIFVRKVAPTQNRFPRRIGIPEKRPLCL
ncbi:MAG: 16S rRNA (guanine(527)-N(7))-methyltransferase RsmG [bacterium]|nr:16S rRNA (guanine(527)-N(7))-methyltransferase RsmG [bacterium]